MESPGLVQGAVGESRERKTMREEEEEGIEAVKSQSPKREIRRYHEKLIQDLQARLSINEGEDTKNAFSILR